MGPLSAATRPTPRSLRPCPCSTPPRAGARSSAEISRCRLGAERAGSDRGRPGIAAPRGPTRPTLDALRTATTNADPPGRRPAFAPRGCGGVQRTRFSVQVLLGDGVRPGDAFLRRVGGPCPLVSGRAAFGWAVDVVSGIGGGGVWRGRRGGLTGPSVHGDTRPVSIRARHLGAEAADEISGVQRAPARGGVEQGQGRSDRDVGRVAGDGGPGQPPRRPRHTPPPSDPSGATTRPTQLHAGRGRREAAHRVPSSFRFRYGARALCAAIL